MAEQQAFPLQHTNADANSLDFKNGNSGLTMRQYYKAQIISGCVAIAANQPLTSSDLSDLAKTAGMIADAMIAEDEEFERNNNQRQPL